MQVFNGIISYFDDIIIISEAEKKTRINLNSVATHMTNKRRLIILIKDPSTIQMG